MGVDNKIDLMRLMVSWNTKKWNAFLTDCLKKRDINRLASVRRSFQVDMMRLARNKLNSPKVVDFFIRIDRSIYKTAKQIVRVRNPMPGDHPQKVTNVTSLDPKWLQAKRARDLEFEAFCRMSAY